MGVVYQFPSEKQRLMGRTETIIREALLCHPEETRETLFNCAMELIDEYLLVDWSTEITLPENEALSDIQLDAAKAAINNVAEQLVALIRKMLLEMIKLKFQIIDVEASRG